MRDGPCGLSCESLGVPSSAARRPDEPAESLKDEPGRRACRLKAAGRTFRRNTALFLPQNRGQGKYLEQGKAGAFPWRGQRLGRAHAGKSASGSGGRGEGQGLHLWAQPVCATLAAGPGSCPDLSGSCRDPDRNLADRGLVQHSGERGRSKHGKTIQCPHRAAQEGTGDGCRKGSRRGRRDRPGAWDVPCFP